MMLATRIDQKKLSRLFDKKFDRAFFASHDFTCIKFSYQKAQHLVTTKLELAFFQAFVL